MRKLIVQQFALDAWIRVFGRVYNFPRASRIIFPLFVLAGIAEIYETFEAVTLILCAISVFFGFVYFRFYPVKFDELNDVQKYQYSLRIPLSEKERAQMAGVWDRLQRKFKL